MKNFRQLFEESKGFCLPHFGDLIETAENKLNDAQKKEFYPKAFALMQENMERLQKEVAWFVEKNDYRNKDKEMYLIPGAEHIKTYFVPEYVNLAVNKMKDFFGMKL